MSIRLQVYPARLVHSMPCPHGEMLTNQHEKNSCHLLKRSGRPNISVAHLQHGFCAQGCGLLQDI